MPRGLTRSAPAPPGRDESVGAWGPCLRTGRQCPRSSPRSGSARGTSRSAGRSGRGSSSSLGRPGRHFRDRRHSGARTRSSVLNTLGGALAVHTKNGRDFPGTTLEVSGGSFGRWEVEAQHGGFRGPFDWFISFRALNEDGWRDESDERAAPALHQGRMGIGGDRRAPELRLRQQRTRRERPGAREHSWRGIEAPCYTFPDQTQNLMHLVNVTGSHQLTESLLLSANAFYRYYRRRTLNGDAEVACVDDAYRRVRRSTSMASCCTWGYARARRPGSPTRTATRSRETWSGRPRPRTARPSTDTQRLGRHPAALAQG